MRVVNGPWRWQQGVVRLAGGWWRIACAPAVEVEDGDASFEHAMFDFGNQADPRIRAQGGENDRTIRRVGATQSLCCEFLAVKRVVFEYRQHRVLEVASRNPVEDAGQAAAHFLHAGRGLMGIELQYGNCLAADLQFPAFFHGDIERVITGRSKCRARLFRKLSTSEETRPSVM